MSSPAKREWIFHEYQAKKFQIKSKDPEKEIVYPNQADAAAEIVKAFLVENKVAVTLIALPQAGKTGTFLEVAYRMCTFNDDVKAIDPEQLLIITGMSDREWRHQTSHDMLTTFQKRVKHRGQFESVPTLLSTLHDSLIIIDECHIAAEKEQSMSAMLKTAGLLNIETLRKRRIFLLEVSATPGATLYDTAKWGPENHSIVILKESPKYVGFRDFIAEKRLHDSFDLTKEEEVVKFLNFIEAQFPQPRWHIVRISGRKSPHYLIQHARERKWEINPHNAVERMGELDFHMSKQPMAHSIILIKEFWRAGKRLCDKYIGVVHEPITCIEDTNVTSQGLVGRLCGNDKRKGAGAPHAFCNTALIKDYLKWIDANVDYSKVERYKSRNLTANKGRVTSHESFVHHSNVNGVEAPEEKEGIPILVMLSEKLIKQIQIFFGILNSEEKKQALQRILMKAEEDGEFVVRTDMNSPGKTQVKFSLKDYTIEGKRICKEGDNTANYRFPQFYQHMLEKKPYGQSVSTEGKFVLDITLVPFEINEEITLQPGTAFISFQYKKKPQEVQSMLPF